MLLASCLQGLLDAGRDAQHGPRCAKTRNAVAWAVGEQRATIAACLLVPGSFFAALPHTLCNDCCSLPATACAKICPHTMALSALPCPAHLCSMLRQLCRQRALSGAYATLNSCLQDFSEVRLR